MRLLLASMALLMLFACSKHQIRVDRIKPGLTAGDFERVRDAWSRTDKDYLDLVATAVVSVTYKSREFRRAMVLKLVRDLKLNSVDRQKLVEKERKDADKYHTFFFSVSTNQPKWNNLERKEESIWYIQLENGRKQRIKAVSVKKLDEDSPKYKILYEYVTPFSLIYYVRFPRQLPSGQPILTSGTRSFSIEMRSVVAKLRFIWKLAAN